MKEIFRGKNLHKKLPLRGAQAMVVAGSLLLGSSHDVQSEDNYEEKNNQVFLPMIIHDDARINIEEFSSESEVQVLTEALEMQKEIEYTLLNPTPVRTEIPKPVIAPPSGGQVASAEVHQGTQNSGKIGTTGENLWLVLADCETGDNVIGAPFYAQWDYNGPSGFDGGLQFHPDTWNRLDTGYDFAWQAPADIQIAAAKEWLSRASWGQWPGCRDKMIANGYEEEMESEGRLR